MFSTRLKKLIAIIVMVCMVFKNTGITTFADSVNNYTYATTTSGEEKNYSSDEENNLKEYLPSNKNFKDGENEEKETTKESTSEKINEENESTTVEEPEDDETTTVEEPEDDETTTVVESEEDETTTTVAELEEDETTTTVVEPEKNETTTTVVESEENETTTTSVGASFTSPKDETTKKVVESEENETTTTVAESEKDETTTKVVASEETATDSDADYDAVVKEEMNGDDTATQSETLINLELEQPELGSGLFGAAYYTLPADWYRPLLIDAGPTAEYRYTGFNAAYETISIAKFPTSVPAGTKYDIAGSDGLEFYVDGLNITIYAPQNKPIYAGNSIYDLTTSSNFGMFGGKSISNVDGITPLVFSCRSINQINNLSLLDTSQTVDFSNFFLYLINVHTLDLRAFNFSNAMNISSMFAACNNLQNIMFTSVDFSNVVDASGLFSFCQSLTNIDLANWNVSNIQHARGMFKNCSSITSLDLSNWNMTSLIEIGGFDTFTGDEGMFAGCSGLIDLNISKFDTRNVTNMSYLFKSCPNLRKIVVGPNFSLASVTAGNDVEMFEGCTSLVGESGTTYNSSITDGTYARIDAGPTSATPGYFTSNNDFTLTKEWFDQMTGMIKSNITSISIENSAVASTGDELYFIDNSNGLQVERNGTVVKIHAPRLNNIKLPQNSEGLFANFTNLTTIDGLDLASTSNVTNMSRMFENCTQLTHFDLSSFDTRNVIDFSNMFHGCDGLTGTLDLSMFNTKSARDMSHMFENCRNLTGINVSSFDTSVVTDMSAMFRNCSSITSIDISNFKDDLVTSTEQMFYLCVAIQTININPNNFRAITETNMDNMFDGCMNLTTVDVSGFCGTNVISMKKMFKLCQALTTINLPNFVAASSSNASEMFYDCRALTTLNISRLDTQSVENMKLMFENCQSLSSIDVSHFNTSKVRLFGGMFSKTVITSIDLSHFDTSQATEIQSMFADCPNLTSVNVSGWDTSRVTMIGGMFNNCPRLTTIYADKDFSQASIISYADMFRGCVNLVGGEGTAYDSNNVTMDYAKVDGSYDKLGYFTATPWTVTLNSNGGKYANGSSTKNVSLYEGVSTSKFEKPTKVGYVFDKYYNGTTVINDTWTYGGAVSQITAHYIPNNYKVRYNANGGKGTMGVDVATYGEAYKVKATAYKNEGYSFAGWTYAGNTYGANVEVSNLTSEKDGEVVFTATWGPKSTTINYHANGGVGTMSSKDFVYGNDATLDPCTFTRDGYTFNGWALSAKADATLGDEATIFAEETYREVIDVYATWINNQVIYGTLELKGNGGYINGVENYKRYYEQGEQIKDVTKYRKGYDFENWHNNAGSVVTYPIVCDFNNTLTLTADWSQLTYKVRYHANNGTGAYFDDDVLASVTNYTAKSLADLGWTKANYTFQGWALRSDDTVAVYGDAGNIGSINKTKLDLYAVWTGVPYTITLHNFDPTAAGAARDKVDSFTYGNNKKISEVVNKEYSVGTTKYLFSGWTRLVSGNQVMYYDTHNADIVYELEAGTSGINIDLYAIWIKKTDAVYMTFDGNGGTINGEGKLTVTLASNSVIPYPSGRLMYKKGELHDAWLDTDKLTPYNEVVVNFIGSKTIYASWTTVGATYTLKYTAFDIDTTSPVMADEIKDCDATFNLTENSYTRFGYGFIGWDTKEDADVVVYTDRESVSNLGDAGETVTLWAVWSDKDYTIRYYDYNNTLVDKATISFVERKTIISNANIPIGKEDIGFRYTDSHGNIKRFNTGQVVSINDFEINETTTYIDLYGEIKNKIYHITFNANGGTFQDGTEVKTATISYMQEIKFPAVSQRTNYYSKEWGTKVEYYSYDEDKVFSVKWVYNGPSGPGGGTSGGGGGGSRTTGGIFKQLDRAINFVVQTPIEENEYSFINDSNGRKIGISLNANSKVGKALVLSSEAKESYQLMSNGYMQLKGGGLFKVKLVGQECYFAVDDLGNLMTGFVVTSDKTTYISVNSDYSIKKSFEQKGDKYYLYEEDGPFRGMLWNQPIVVANTLYTFDTQGRVVSTVDTSVGQGIWEYNPTENKWKFFTADNNGQVTYYKDGVYNIFYNNQVLKFGFDKDGNMLTGVYNLNGVTYYSKDSGAYAGAITNI